MSHNYFLYQNDYHRHNLPRSLREEIKEMRSKRKEKKKGRIKTTTVFSSNAFARNTLPALIALGMVAAIVLTVILDINM